MYFVLLFVVLINCIRAVTIPSYFPKCFVDDPCVSDCFLNAANKLRPLLTEGVKEIGMSSIKPLILRNITINHKAVDANFKVKAKRVDLYGLHHFEIKELEFLPKNILLKGVMRFGDVHVFSDYVIGGHIVGIPVTGNGFFKGLAGPSNVSFVLRGDLIRIRGVEYCKLNDVQIKFKINKFVMSFDRLENDQGSWGKTNEILQEKSNAVALAMVPVMNEVVKKFLQNYLTWFFREIPYSNLFPNSPRQI
ncbi:hypothetical protein FQR65_LT02605 [Abscondita terminalis]|nr:hypothetical protein FQR65_LT02605 [Abscondita terminalis]